MAACGVDDARNQALGLINIQTGVPLARPSASRLLKMRVTRGQSTPMARSSSAACEDLVWLSLQRNFAMVEHEYAVTVLESRATFAQRRRW